MFILTLDYQNIYLLCQSLQLIQTSFVVLYKLTNFKSEKSMYHSKILKVKTRTWSNWKRPSTPIPPQTWLFSNKYIIKFWSKHFHFCTIYFTSVSFLVIIFIVFIICNLTFCERGRGRRFISKGCQQWLEVWQMTRNIIILLCI